MYKYYVDGEFKVSSSGKLVNILNPATNQVQFKVQGMVVHIAISSTRAPHSVHHQGG